MRYLIKAAGRTRQGAQLLRISQRTAERHVKNQTSELRPDLATRREREVKKRWQPQNRPRAADGNHGRASSSPPRARMGYTAPIGSTDQDRIRHPTAVPPPRYAARLFDIQEAGVTDQECQEIAAEALKKVYFQDGGRRAGSLEEVRCTDTELLEVEL